MGLNNNIEKICRHETLVQIPKTRFKECKECSVWKGEREDPHAYIKEYYTSETLQIFKHKIIRRSWYFHIHKTVLKNLGVPFLNFKRYLEIGCSVGRILWTLYRDHGKECVGVESSDWAVTWMRETLGFSKNFKIYRTNFEWMDKKVLGKFDFIYACHVMEHFEDPMKTLEQCYKMLNDNGWLYFVVPDKKHQMGLHTHSWTFDKEVLRKWFTQLGLKNIKIGMTKPYNGELKEEEIAGYYLHVVGRKLNEKEDKK